ncbi:MAG: class I SAM-dependent methyltransferase [Saprospiraceae bacterium]|nr:class I SAM-dependent methyltransferase [Saprospiraceae bacterium]
MNRITNILLYSFLPILLFAQPDTTAHNRIIKGILDYRNELIARNPEGFKQVYRLEEIWKAEDKEEVEEFMSNATHAYHILGYSPKSIIKLVHKHLPDFKLQHLLTEETVLAIVQNDDWMNLLRHGYLKPNPPFQIDSKTGLFEELSFYKIRDGMKIAELGAGDGTFCLLLGLAFDSLTVYVNDVDRNAVKYAASKFEHCESIRASNRYLMVEGKNKSTELEAVKIDKIIIRNSFHHFSHQPEMLASIRASLSPDGDLYITDPTLLQDKKPECDKAMSLEALRAIIEANGFKIVEEKQLKDWSWVMLHCKPN